MAIAIRDEQDDAPEAEELSVATPVQDDDEENWQAEAALHGVSDAGFYHTPVDRVMRRGERFRP